MSEADGQDHSDARAAVLASAAPAAPDQAEGPTKFGAYDLLTSIGQGGMGEIFVASRNDGNWRELVALKVLLPEANRNHSFVAMFMDEASIMSKIDHPNVLKVYDFGKEAGSYFLAMEYLQGQSLARIIIEAWKRFGHLTFRDVALIGAGAARGLHAAHTATNRQGEPLNVIHRDVSPQNIFVTYAGIPKVIDFGIARAAERITATSAGIFKGKAAYMSPEQIESSDIDARSDVWALGVCLWEMTTGRRLFAKPNQFDTLTAVQDAPIDTPTEVAGKTDARLDEIIMSALSRDHQSRTPTARALEVALTDYLRELGEPAQEAQTVALMKDLFGTDAEQEKKLLQGLERREKTDAFALRRLSGISQVASAEKAVTIAGRVSDIEDLDQLETHQSKRGPIPTPAKLRSDSQPLPDPKARSEAVHNAIQALATELTSLEERQREERRASNPAPELPERRSSAPPAPASVPPPASVPAPAPQSNRTALIAIVLGVLAAIGIALLLLAPSAEDAVIVPLPARESPEAAER